MTRSSSPAQAASPGQACAASPVTERSISTAMTMLLAVACGLIVANIYYAQPLAGPISLALGMPPAAAGLIVTMTQIGYGLGLLLIVPLGDLIENRRLIVGILGIGIAALLAAALSTHPAPFLAAAVFIGIGSVSVQVLVPFAAHLAPPHMSGRVVGNVISGLMFGIMLARPVSSFIAQVSSWHTVFYVSAGVMVLLALVLSRALPKRVPPHALGYGQLLASMWHLVLTTPVLRRRSAYQFFLFGAFSLFWTTTPLLLAGPAFHMSQAGIALFALAGAAGGIATPIAGRVADRGWSKPASGLAMLAVASAFLLTHRAPAGTTAGLVLLVCAAILLDFGVAANLTLSQRAIFVLGEQSRSRLNGLFMATFFVGGALGSAAGGWAYSKGGWFLASWVGLALPVAALAYYMTERKSAAGK